MLVYGYRIPDAASLIVWAILWEIAGRLRRDDPAAATVALIVRMVEIIPTPPSFRRSG